MRSRNEMRKSKNTPQGRAKPRPAARRRTPKAARGRHTGASRHTKFRAALKLIGPQPLKLAASLWAAGLEALEALGPGVRAWHPGIQAAAIMTLTEDRPGMRDFWAGVHEGRAGWPALLLSASEQLATFDEGQAPERQAELALYMASRFVAKTSLKRVDDKYLHELREPFEVHRVRALQSVFVGRLPRKNRGEDEAWSPQRSRRPTAQISVKLQGRTPAVVTLEKAFHQDVTRVLTARVVRTIAQQIAVDYVPGDGVPPLSSIVHDALTELIAENLTAARVLGIQDVERFANPTLRTVPRPKKPRTQDKRSPDDVPYQRNTSVIVNCAYRQGKGTAVSLARPLYELACKRLGRQETYDTFRHAAEQWDPETTELSRSEAAREALLLALSRELHGR